MSDSIFQNAVKTQEIRTEKDDLDRFYHTDNISYAEKQHIESQDLKKYHHERIDIRSEDHSI